MFDKLLCTYEHVISVIQTDGKDCCGIFLSDEHNIINTVGIVNMYYYNYGRL